MTEDRVLDLIIGNSLPSQPIPILRHLDRAPLEYPCRDEVPRVFTTLCD